MFDELYFVKILGVGIYTVVVANPICPLVLKPQAKTPELEAPSATSVQEPEATVCCGPTSIEEITKLEIFLVDPLYVSCVMVLLVNPIFV